MRNFTTFLSLAAALTLSAAGTRTLVPNPFNAPVVNPMEQVANRTDVKALSKDQAAQRMAKTPEARAIQMQLNTLKAKPAAATAAKAPSRAEGEETEVLLEENFDLFASGSEDEIDTSIDLSGYVTDFENGYCDPYGSCEIDPKYTQTPGWTGECVYQAGGAAALYYPYIGGILNTPNNLVFNGVIRVSFRVKAIGDYRCLLFVVPCKGSFDNISMASDAVWCESFSPKDGWQDVVLEYDVPYAGEDGFLQFNGMNYDDGVIIDDLKVERVLDKVMSPYSINTTCYTDEGFALYWTGDPKSDGYIVNLWEKVTDSSSAAETLDFNNMTYDADGMISDFGASENWTFDLATIGSQVGTNPNDGTEAIRVIYDEERYWNEYWMPAIYTPSGSLVSDFKAEIVVTKENTVVNESWGYIMEAEWLACGIDAEGNENYLAMGLIDNVEGTTVNLDLSALEDYLYGTTSDYTDKYYGIVLYVLPDGDGEVIVDNISFGASGALVETQIATDLKTVDESVVFTGLDMTGHHYYTVQAFYGDYVTPEMERIEAFGIPAPVALPATNIDERGEFTANWEAVDGASAYYIHTKFRYTAPEDIKDYAVINDGFDKKVLTYSYTMDDPYQYDYYTVKSLDDFTVVPGWTAYGALIADGMIGCARDESAIRYICSPTVDFSNGDGIATVYAKAYGTFGDKLAVMFSDGQVYYTPFEEDGSVEVTLVFSNLDYGCFYFYSGYTGDRVFLDEVRISQDLYDGETVEINTGIWYIGDGTACSCDFSGLNILEGMKYYYSVYSYAYSDMLGRQYLSESSNDIEVDFNTDALRSIEAKNLSVTVDGNTILTSEAANIYDLQGRQVAANATSATVANGIYVVKTSTKACKVIVK